MRGLFALLLLLALALAPPLAAEETPAPAPPDLADTGEDIAPEDWRALVAGRTVWYRIGPDLWGRERYAVGADRVVFQFADGECVEGGWTYEAPWYCFDFQGALTGAGPHCFRHLRHDSGLWVLSLAGEAQAVVKIDATPLSCGPDVVS